MALSHPLDPAFAGKASVGLRVNGGAGGHKGRPYETLAPLAGAPGSSARGRLFPRRRSALRHPGLASLRRERRPRSSAIACINSSGR